MCRCAFVPRPKHADGMRVLLRALLRASFGAVDPVVAALFFFLAAFYRAVVQVDALGRCVASVERRAAARGNA